MIAEAVRDGKAGRILSDPHSAMSEAQLVALESAAHKSGRCADAESVKEPLRVRQNLFYSFKAYGHANRYAVAEELTECAAIADFGASLDSRRNGPGGKSAHLSRETFSPRALLGKFRNLCLPKRCPNLLFLQLSFSMYR